MQVFFKSFSLQNEKPKENSLKHRLSCRVLLIARNTEAFIGLFDETILFCGEQRTKKSFHVFKNKCCVNRNEICKLKASTVHFAGFALLI